MSNELIRKEDLEKWATILLEHSLGGVSGDDRVMIKGESVCWPLISVLEQKVFEMGGVADVHIVAPNNDRGRVWSATAARCGSQEKLLETPEWHGQRYESMTKYIEVLGAQDPGQYSGLQPEQEQILAKTDRPYSTIRLTKPWVLTLYPTQGFAEMEGLPVDEYVRFIIDASTTDPRPLRDAEERLAPLFLNGKTMTIVTTHPDDGRELSLKLDISSSRPALSYGLRNFPDGEIFTSPDARHSEGEIYLDLTINKAGSDVQGVYLKFVGGEVVEHSAKTGGDVLKAIVETDAGSRRLGEVALGMNPGMTKVLKHPLLVEKVGGTLHVALGASYEQAYVEDVSSDDAKDEIERLFQLGVLNRSAQHVDIVTDFRDGGCGKTVLIDDIELEVRNGLWVPTA